MLRLIRETMAADAADARAASVPPIIRVTPDATEAVLAAANDFTRMLVTQSNTISTNAKKNIILPHHVIEATRQLEFGRYVPAMEASGTTSKEAAKDRKSRMKKGFQELDGLTDEEKIALQQEMLRGAMERQQQADAERRAIFVDQQENAHHHHHHAAGEPSPTPPPPALWDATAPTPTPPNNTEPPTPIPSLAPPPVLLTAPGINADDDYDED